MSSVNKVFILGRLGKDPEIRYTSDGKPVATISVATSTVGKDAQGNKTEHTEWHRLSAFNRAAEVAGKYLKKGDQLFVEGSLRTKKWNDNGVDKYATEIVVGRLNLLGGKSEQHGAGTNVNYGGAGVAGSNGVSPTMDSSIDDDLPF